jgi:hypothetical protein
MKLQQLLEALKPSQYRNLVKGWDKSKYADLFGDKYRIYIPLGEKAKDVKPNSEVESFVKSQGYEIEDYLTGIASKDNGKRQIKIGKLLAKETELKKLFDKDPQRTALKSKYIVVISRHPYDIAGMSTGRKWTSCMNLKDRQGQHFVPLDIKEGTLVAYLIKETDTNIEHPSARILIKPFINLDGSGEIALGIEKGVTYGTAPDEFDSTVIDWVNNINKSKNLNGIFVLNNKLNNDSLDSRTYIKGIGDVDEESVETFRILKNNPDYFKELKNPSEKLQKMAVSLNPYLVTVIKDPSEGVQIAAVKKDGYIISDIIKMGITPSEGVQLAAIESTPGAFMAMSKVMTEKVQLQIVKANIKAFRFIKTPFDSVKKYYEEHK